MAALGLMTPLRAMAAIVQRMVPELADDTILLNRFPLFAPVSFVFEETLRLPGYYRGREAAVRMLLMLRPLHAAMPAWEPPARDIQ